VALGVLGIALGIVSALALAALVVALVVALGVSTALADPVVAVSGCALSFEHPVVHAVSPIATRKRPRRR
jgi:hypothetical protein